MQELARDGHVMPSWQRAWCSVSASAAPRPVVITLPDGVRIDLHHDMHGPYVLGLVLRGPDARAAAEALKAVASAAMPVPVLVGAHRRLIHTFEIKGVRGDELRVRLITVPLVAHDGAGAGRGSSRG